MLLLSPSDFLFQITVKVSNILDTDQAQCFFRPDLGPNCLQRLSVDDRQANS